MGEEKYLGHMLVEAGLLDAYQVKSALGRQKKFGGRFASNVKALGFLPERDLAIFLSRQIGVPAIDISASVIKLSNFDLIPRDVMENNNIVPVRVEGNRLFLAMADPKDIAVIDEVQFLTGLRVIEHVALLSSITSLINDAFSLKSVAGKKFFFGEDVSAQVAKDPLGYIEILTADSPLSGSGSLVNRTRQNPDFDGIQAPGPVLDLEEFESGSQDDNEILFADPKPADLQGNEGGILSFSDPEPEPARDSRSELAEPSMAEAKAKILVVDDEKDILLMLERILQKNGYHVVTASTGTEALVKIRDEAPDLILLDAMLPEIHGFEICQKVKASKRFSHTPVIIVSAIYKGWRFKQDVRKLYGADGYIEKPFKIPEVLKEVDRLLTSREGDDSRDQDEEVTEAARQEYNLGLKAYQEKNTEKALEHFNKAVKMSPFSFQLHFYLGNLYTKIDKLYQAINEYERAVELAPNFFPALKNLALLYQKMGFKNKALEMWERSLGACPDESTKGKIKKQILELL